MLGLGIAVAASVAGVHGTQDAIANGDTRTINLTHAHRNDSVSITFRRNGRYDPDALEQLNWFLRDWRTDERTKMEPRLFDIIWEVQREVGSHEPVIVLSAYRAPETNAMLRRRSRAVSEHSQHMLGKAMDIRMPDVDMARVRAIGIRLQHGGVGYYPSSGFVHLDAGSVRAWPRMTQDQLARLFPDGKTVHLPPSGKPFPRYEEARAEILARGEMVGGYGGNDGEGAGGRRSLWATLFGGGDEDGEYYGAGARGRGLFGSRSASAYAPADREGSNARTQVASASASDGPAPSSRFRFFWEKNSEPAVAPQPGSVQDPMQTAALPPVPPRRPDEIAPALADVPTPPARPIELAVAFAPPAALAAPKTGPAQNERAALRALFVAAVTPSPASSAARAAPIATSRARPQPLPATGVVADLGPALNLGFSSKPTGDLTVTAFTGPAVKPLPVLR